MWVRRIKSEAGAIHSIPNPKAKNSRARLGQIPLLALQLPRLYFWFEVFPSLRETNILPSFWPHRPIPPNRLLNHFCFETSLGTCWMPAPDHFDTSQSVRLRRPQPPRIAAHRPRSSRRSVFKRLCLVTTVIIFGVVLFSVENAAKLLTNLTATMVVPGIPQLTQAPRLPFDSGESSIAKTEPIGSEDRVSTLIEPARASVEAATPQTLEMQFEAWAAEQDAQRLTKEPLSKDSPKTIPERADEGTTGAPVQKDRVSRSIRRVRTRVSPQDPPKEVRQVQNARVQAVPPQRNGAAFSQASAVRN